MQSPRFFGDLNDSGLIFVVFLRGIFGMPHYLAGAAEKEILHDL